MASGCAERISRPIEATQSSRLLSMATGEAAACLNDLIAKGSATCVTDQHSVARFQATHA